MSPTTNGEARLFDVDPVVVDNPPFAPLVSRPALGSASEHLVIARLLAMGYRPYVPIVDDHGVDLLVNKQTIQIKAASGYTLNSQCYRFSICGARYDAAGTYTLERHNFSADVFILHGIRDDAWWIVPQRVILECGFDPAHNISFSLSVKNAKPGSKYGRLHEFRDAWSVLGDPG